MADATRWRPNRRYDLIVSSFALPESKAGRALVYRMIRDAIAPGGTVLLKDFDDTMKRVKFFATFDLVTVEELTAGFDGFGIIKAEIVDVPAHDHSSGRRQMDERWTAAFPQAQSP